MPGQKNKVSARKIAILYLLDAADEIGAAATPILHTTRLQKLLFLLTEQSFEGLDPEWWDMDFAYEPEKFGPADLELYQDLEFLAAVGHITTGQSAELSDVPSLEHFLSKTDDEIAPPEELEEREELSFDYLIGGLNNSKEIVPQEDLRRYAITSKGTHFLHRIENQGDLFQSEQLELLRSACGKMKAEFGSWTLSRLLRYVYQKYPRMTTKSTIRDQVLGK